MKTVLILLALAGAVAAAPGRAAPPLPPPDPLIQPRKMAVEIYRIAPGRHEAFLRLIAQYDAANRAAGLPARQLYVHQDGAEWDFLIIQPEETTPEQDKAVDAALTRMGAPQGAKFFFEIRKFIAAHTDTMALGPTTAADWLARLDK
jgi:hypothetical protein